MELNRFVGNRIRQLREKHSMTQDQLANKLNTTRQTISRYETGDRKTNQDILFKLSKIFGVSVNSFFPDELIDKNKNADNSNGNKIDITDAIQEGKILAYEGKEIPKEEVEMIRRIIEGRKHNG
ncbi:transcriptional regulator [Bombilactobacillus bombi]|uniref:Transcriptional regulator n=1 Tax=Bombilactobacillus bombi TaxID=1303590 RepID=A0A3R6V8P7_9LACO|nr:helix-turn-helix transcriptional regulator [Bombilactobacillus bombi]RHW49697.1 transcriptional regulator [Bombilactobacillus bombi]